MLAPELSGLSESPVVDSPASLGGVPEPEAVIPSAGTQFEDGSDQLASPAPASELLELSESPMVGSPTSPTSVQDSEAPAQSTTESSPAVPFSWNSIFDGAWKFAAGTLSSSSPGTFTKPEATSQEVEELESAQPESDSEHSAPLNASIPEPPSSLSDHEPLPVVHPAVLSEVDESIAATDAIREFELPQPATVVPLEEPLRPEEPSTLPIEVPSSFRMELPTQPVPEPAEPAPESEPVFFISRMEQPQEAPLPEVSIPEPSLSVVIPETPPAPEAISTEQREVPSTLVPTEAAPSPSARPSDVPSASPVSMEEPSHWSTGEVEVQPHRPTEKKRNWDKEKGEATVVPPTSSPFGEEDPEPLAEPSHGWESAPSEAVPPLVEAVVPAVEEVVPQEDTRPEWVRASESITFVNPQPLPLPQRGRIPASSPFKRSQNLRSRSLRRRLTSFLTQRDKTLRFSRRIERHRRDRILGLAREWLGSASASRLLSGPVFRRRNPWSCCVWGWHSPASSWWRSVSGRWDWPGW